MTTATRTDVAARAAARVVEAERLAAQARETGLGIVARERNLEAARRVAHRLASVS